ncbi:glycosyltransferase family 49 protein [Hydnomerulius pinastri MD-312]|uniref:Glycosyltransferase family 49 protein n=1 Tax=Hydnomerulius pinastri MD-312 TaxID=994086 RepID=A0A0C9VXN7_9AGAM|nr:glycosyltransferase family 49 protein [Hydnomerulius pinastri MD-312]
MSGDSSTYWQPFTRSHPRPKVLYNVQAEVRDATETPPRTDLLADIFTAWREGLWTGQDRRFFLIESILPNYATIGSAAFEKDDITITTLVTVNRFKVFAKLGAGPISAAIHVKPSASHAVLDALHDLYTSTPGMSTFTDVHLVLSPFDRQINTWLNAARLFARTDFVMMLDVDFAICTDFRSHIRASIDSEVGHLLCNGRVTLVVPAFEFIKQQDGANQNLFPSDKKLVKAKKIDMSHRSWAPGHNSSDYPRFYTAPPGEVFEIKHYQSASSLTRDERFAGYGGNKATCLYEMYLSGMSFFVLADHFLVHQSHAYEEVARRLERKAIEKYIRKSKKKSAFGGMQEDQGLSKIAAHRASRRCMIDLAINSTLHDMSTIRAATHISDIAMINPTFFETQTASATYAPTPNLAANPSATQHHGGLRTSDPLNLPSSHQLTSLALLSDPTRATQESSTTILPIIGAAVEAHYTSSGLNHYTIECMGDEIKDSFLAGHPEHVFTYHAEQPAAVAQISGRANSSQDRLSLTEFASLFIPNGPQPASFPTGNHAASNAAHGNNCCRWQLRDNGQCNASIGAGQQAVVDHIRQCHGGLPGTRSASLFRCYWGSCQMELKPQSVARHLAKHVGAKWRCSGCNAVLSRKDYAVKHTKQKEMCRDAAVLPYAGV